VCTRGALIAAKILPLMSSNVTTDVAIRAVFIFLIPEQLDGKQTWRSLAVSLQYASIRRKIAQSGDWQGRDVVM
jgi:hypothetical protein